MAIYTVHEPPPRKGESDPVRFSFVRDGFSFWAFLFGPAWMLLHRLWLVLIGYAVVAAVLQVALAQVDRSGTANFVVGLLLALLIGFEAASLRRWTLDRRRWRNLGVVVADDLELAERRFFDAWVAGLPALRPAPEAAAAPRRTGTTPDVIGLFPQPGARP
jgi:Protein of unknown function (DUF2628)